MSESKTPYKPLLVDENIVVKLAEHTKFYVCGNPAFDATHLYTSTKQLVDTLVYRIIKSLSHEELLGEGIKSSILEPGKNWLTGKFRFHLVCEFLTDESEIA